jgi:hypothetical protein
MKTWTSRIVLTLLIFSATTLAFADVIPPGSKGKHGGRIKKPSDIKVRMNIYPDSNITEAKLIIPRKVLQQLKAENDSDDSQNADATNKFNFTKTQTVMVGLFLSLSIVFGGVWFARARSTEKKTPRIVAAVALLAFVGATATAVYANAGPPPVARSLTSKILIPEATYYGVWGEVNVEVVEEGEQIILRLPKPTEKLPQ